MDAGLVMGTAFVLVGGLVLAVIGHRGLRNGGAGSGASGTADAFGNFIDVFDPGQARAARDIKQHHDAGPVARTPDDEDDDPVRLIRNPDGSPRSVRVRRTGRRSAVTPPAEAAPPAPPGARAPGRSRSR
jgi:hypothetical protein